MPVPETLAALRKGYGAHSAAQSRGAGCLTLAWALAIAAPVAAAKLDDAFIRNGTTLSGWELLLPTIPILLPCLLGTIGVFWLTRRPPRHIAHSTWLRLAARWLFVIATPFFCAAACADWVERLLWMNAATSSANANAAIWLNRLAASFLTGAYLLFLAVPVATALLFWYSSTFPFTRIKSRFAARLVAAIVLYVTGYSVLVELRHELQARLLDFADYRTLFALSVGVSAIFAGIVGFTYWLNLWLRARKIARVGKRLIVQDGREALAVAVDSGD